MKILVQTSADTFFLGGPFFMWLKCILLLPLTRTGRYILIKYCIVIMDIHIIISVNIVL